MTTTEQADVTDLVGLREKVKKYAEEVKGVKLTYLPFIIKAVVAALKKHPFLNSSMDEEAKRSSSRSTTTSGSRWPPTRAHRPGDQVADQKEIFSLAQEIKDLAAAAASRKIDLADLKGGTFSITNYGAFGGIYATPITNYPEAAILGMGRIQEVPWVKDGEVTRRKVLYLSLSFDHRLMDGARPPCSLTT